MACDDRRASWTRLKTHWPMSFRVTRLGLNVRNEKLKEFMNLFYYVQTYLVLL